MSLCLRVIVYDHHLFLVLFQSVVLTHPLKFCVLYISVHCPYHYYHNTRTMYPVYTLTGQVTVTIIVLPCALCLSNSKICLFVCTIFGLTISTLYNIWSHHFNTTIFGFTISTLHNIWSHHFNIVQYLVSPFQHCTIFGVTISTLYNIWSHHFNTIQYLVSPFQHCTIFGVTISTLYNI